MPFEIRDRPPEPKVQLNTQIPWAVMAHLNDVSAETGISKSKLVLDALLRAYPLPEDEAASV